MGDIVLTFDTRSIKLPPGESTTNFTYKLASGIRLPNLAYTVRLQHIFTWYSFHTHNLEEYRNTQFTIDDGVSPFTITIPDGIYNTGDFADAVAAALTAVSASHTGKVVFSTNEVTGKIIMTLSAGYSVTMSIASAQQFGFEQWAPDQSLDAKKNNTITYNATTVSGFMPSWSMGIDSINISVDIVGNAWRNGESSNVIGSFVPRLVPPYGSMYYEPVESPRPQANKTNIDRLRIQLTDQSGRVINLNGDHLSGALVISPM